MTIVTLFGILRGLAILPAVGVRTPADLARLHRLIERFRPLSRTISVVTQIGVLAAAATVLGGIGPGLVVAAIFMIVTWALRDGLEDPMPRRSRVAEPAIGLQPLSNPPS
jgi:hypothetical protein